MNKKERFQFNKDYQESILKFTITDYNGYKALVLYKDNYFDLLEHQIIAKALKDHYDKKSTIPSKVLLKEQLRRLYLTKDYADALTHIDKKSINKLINKLYKGIVKDGDEILESCIQFARYVELKHTIERIDIDNFSEYETYSRKIKTAITIGRDFKREKGTFLIADVKERQYRRHAEETIFPTPFKQLNVLTNAWGYNKGSVIVLMGKEKEFKTSMLVNIGTSYIKMNKNVLYIDLENSEDNLAARAEQSLIHVTKRELLSGRYDKKLQKHFRLYKRIMHGELVIKRMPAYSTAADIQNYMDECYREYGIRFQIAVIDFVALMGASSGNMDEVNRISDAYIDIKNLAEKNGLEAIYTANHINREAEKRKASKYLSSDIAKCKDIGRHVDALIGMQQDENEEEHNILRLEIIEQRDGQRFGSMLFTINPETQFIKEANNEIKRKYGVKENIKDNKSKTKNPNLQNKKFEQRITNTDISSH